MRYALSGARPLSRMIGVLTNQLLEKGAFHGQ